MRRHARVFVTLCFVAILCLTGAHVLAAQATPAPAPTVDVGELRPGDIVRLKIFREPDLSGDFTIDENGVATFPKLGPIKVAGRSAATVKAELVERYSVSLREPSIDVSLLRRISVLGAVKNPGVFPVDPTMSIADVVALAGGPTTLGKMNDVELRRGQLTISRKLNGPVRLGETPIQSGDQLFVPERSWVSRNTGLIAGAITATALITAALIRK